ncbi:helix-turn-helix domain-containing protein [Flavobacterium sp. CF136]|uniref:helix-turn-helix domain-containing protein n=1 Tax=Flavobacterium sp. (strain CF136) TaxID=1144313 RepID=UPI0002719643|nr:helix-turn-helix domain-containing protein [Flavobacterium sp. CF136]EJL65837.1 DNA-binding domain-containing protein, AraC-type [Flavobacterium sp. CF136]
MPTKQTNTNAEIVFTCSEASFYNTEIIAEEHSIVRVLSGELKVIQSNKTYVFGVGETYLFPRNRLATLIKSQKDGLPYKAIVVKLTQDVLRVFYEQKKIQVNLVSKTDCIIPLPKSLLLDSFFSSMLPYFDLDYKLPQELSQLKIQEAITVLRSINKDIDNVLSDFSEPHKINIVEFMEHNYMFNMPIEKFGYLTGRSLTTFKRDFKKAFNTTPQKWLTEKRLELARYQLIKKHRKPIDVFYEVGFENLSHFSFAFKKQFGQSPTELVSQKDNTSR